MNQKLLPKFKEAHPGCNYSESKYSDQYSKIVIESMRDDDTEKQDKIIKRKFEEITKSRTPLGLPIELPGSGAKFKSLTRGSESASEDEISLNSRAQSMRLRAIEKVAA
mgnify:CR=1 FL=1